MARSSTGSAEDPDHGRAATAELYDGFYDLLGKDYRAEARTVLRLARARSGRRPGSLLDVACGTGRHLEAFGLSIPSVVGTDLDPAMLAVAARRCPGVELVAADMVRLDLGRRFDLVTCLFSSIAYVPDLRTLRRAVRRLAAHVAPGGVLVVEPWYGPETWEDDHLAVLVLDEPERKAVRTSRASRRGRRSALDFDFLVADVHGARHLHERHELTLFGLDDYAAAFEAAGLRTDLDEYGLWGHGLVLGVAPVAGRWLPSTR